VAKGREMARKAWWQVKWGQGDRGGAGRSLGAKGRNPEVENQVWKHWRGRGGLSPASRVGILWAGDRGTGGGERGRDMEGEAWRWWPTAAVGRHSMAEGQRLMGAVGDEERAQGASQGFILAGAVRERKEGPSGGL